jgi:hypothetical protein
MSRIEEGTLKSFLAAAAIAFALTAEAGTPATTAGNARDLRPDECGAKSHADRAAPSETVLEPPQMPPGAR